MQFAAECATIRFLLTTRSTTALTTLVYSNAVSKLASLARPSALGKVFGSGALAVVQDVAMIPSCVHPRDKLDSAQRKTTN